MKKVLVYGVYDDNNLGDDFMMLQVNDKLLSSSIKPYFVDFGNKDNYFSNNINNYVYIPLFNNQNKNKFLKLFSILKWLFSKKSISNFDAIIFMGGGYTNEKFGIRNIIKLDLLAKKFKKANKKIYFTGQTVGPASSNKEKYLLKKLYSKANKIIVREKYSKRFLDDLGIKSILSGDDAYLYFSNKQEKKYNKKNVAIVNFKDYYEYLDFKEDYFEFTAKFLKNKNLSTYVIPFRSNASSNEYKINFQLYEYLKKNKIDSHFLVENDVDKFVKVFEMSKYVIGNAYHSITLGVMFKNTVLTSYLDYYYEMKIKGVLSHYNLEDSNVIDIKKLKEFDTKKIKEFDSVDVTKILSEEVDNNWNMIVNEIISE